ncbi:MAG: molybdopterin-dependent oxidoreductase, partial [Acidobacteria bacterium]|nr:molybdopterin-dependent oxidoreductase [Acidobacteriota bacterium]
MAPKATITVNGVRFETEADRLLLHALRDFGIEVPTLCHDERLTPYGGCRMCVVSRKDGRPGLVTTCSTPVVDGMVIETDTAEVIEARRAQLQLIVLNHRMECPVCTRRGDCRLQDLIYEYGTPEAALPFDLVRRPMDLASPIITRDPEKCIVCGRCVRLCDEVQGIAAIGLEGRGLDVHVGTFLERPLDCEFCGQCVNACPVAALSARPYETHVPAWLRASATTTCSLCSCGCQVRVETYEGELERVSADSILEPSQGNLCVKGWLGWDLLSSEERITVPLIRTNGKLVPATWDEAITAVVGKFRESRGRTAAIATPRLTNEDAYLVQRLMRQALGSPHVAMGPTGGLAALCDGLAPVAGAPRSTGSMQDIDTADVVLVLRGDPTRTHPLVKTGLVQSIKKREQKLVLAHAVSGGLERHAEHFLPLHPGTEDVLALGLARLVLEHDPARARACEASGATGFAEWRESLEPYSLARVADVCGLEPLRIEAVATRLIQARAPLGIVVCGTGIPGDEVRASAALFWLMTVLEAGNRTGRVIVLGEKFNLQGGLDMGLDPRFLPAYEPAGDGGRPGRVRVVEVAYVEAAGAAVPRVLIADHPSHELCAGLQERALGLGAGDVL